MRGGRRISQSQGHKGNLHFAVYAVTIGVNITGTQFHTVIAAGSQIAVSATPVPFEIKPAGVGVIVVHAVRLITAFYSELDADLLNHNIP